MANDLVLGVMKDQGINIEDPPEDLKLVVKYLRAAYVTREAPNFGDKRVRQAYFCAYHPHHLVASIRFAKRACQLVPELASDSDIRAVDIGCGAGAASIGFSSYRLSRHKTKISPISWTFIDKQDGWFSLLKAQCSIIGGRYASKDNDRFVDIDFNSADINENKLTAAVSSVKNADILFAQTLITELTESGIKRFIHLISKAKPGTHLLLSDLDLLEVKPGGNFADAFFQAGGKETFEEIDRLKDYFRVPRQPHALDALLDGTSLSIPKREMKLEYCLLRRKTSFPPN